jgi:hypothetical protein
MPEPEIRYCPLGPPTTGRRVSYAWCAECQRVRKSNKDCPMIEAQNG